MADDQKLDAKQKKAVAKALKTSTRNELDKRDQQRLEREKRLRQMRAKDGSKKKIKTGGSSTTKKVVGSVIGALVLIIVLVWILFSTGIAQRNMKPMTINGEKISMLEYNYYFNSVYSQYNTYASLGYAATDSNGSLDLEAENQLFATTDANGNTETWRDTINEQTQETLQQVVAYAAEAEKEGITLTQEDQDSLDEYFANISATYTSSLDLANYYETNYGAGANEKTIRQILERNLLANEYATQYPESYDITDEEIQAEYEANKDTYDYVNYRSFTITTPTAEDDATDEETQQLEDDTAAEAQAILDGITDEESFASAALDQVSEDERQDYIDNDSSLHEYAKASSISPTDVETWLFDSSRVSGDKTLIQSGSTYYLVYFIERSRQEEPAPTVRHILISTSESTTDAEKLEKKAEAEAILAKITSEDDMIAQSEELLASEEAAEATEYTDVYRGEMVKSFEDWCYDPSREPGDTGLVESSYGYHVMYYVSDGDRPYWEDEVASALRSTKFSEDSEALLDEAAYQYTTNALALRFVG
ncbi:MAG: peptidylprolyl isomerase [Oscillospiraceae bacterium]|nr:peptidylprolyl isomerase [Oscillospiraceae bacterium]MDD4367391.1 peptidylprolyl isomerase [Oscillospiraceae bacterium]